MKPNNVMFEHIMVEVGDLTKQYHKISWGFAVQTY